MIKYRNAITLRKMPTDEWRLNSDRGDVYETFSIVNNQTPWTAWWDMNHHSDLREWQKDIARMFAGKYEDLTPFVVFKKGHGHSQPHDIMLAHSEQHKVWILMTNDDFWIVNCDYGQFDFNKKDSLGSVLDLDTRHLLYSVVDGL